jgi:hypothetical protein
MSEMGVMDAAVGRSASAVEQYDVVEVIGKGSFGVVSKIRRREDGKVGAWGILPAFPGLNLQRLSCIRRNTTDFRMERAQLWPHERKRKDVGSFRGQSNRQTPDRWCNGGVLVVTPWIFIGHFAGKYYS